jgi:hypothetical protein
LVAERVEPFLLRGLRLQFSDPGQRYVQLGLKSAKPYVPALRGFNLRDADQTPRSLVFPFLGSRRIAQHVLGVFFGYVNAVILMRHGPPLIKRSIRKAGDRSQILKFIPNVGDVRIARCYVLHFPFAGQPLCCVSRIQYDAFPAVRPPALDSYDRPRAPVPSATGAETFHYERGLP